MARSSQSPSPYPSPSRREGEVENDSNNDIRVDSCDRIVQDDSISSLQSFFQTADGKGFENIEKPKEKKTHDDKAERFRKPEHGDEKTDYLIDDNPLVILFPKEPLGIV